MKSSSDNRSDNLNKTWEVLSAVLRPFAEIVLGVWRRTIPWSHCLAGGTILGICILLRLDYLLAKRCNLLFLYPTKPLVFAIYWLTALLSGFGLWGIYQTGLRKRLIQRLTEVFLDAGLKTATGKLPSYISDQPLDRYARKLYLTTRGLPVSQFEKASASLEAGLQVYIDEIKESRESGTVEILYSHYQMPNLVQLGNIQRFRNYSFFVGRTRRSEIVANLLEVPHFLVGGISGSGKSHFFRQIISTLYLNNKQARFTLIDLKSGLEFQLFENLPRVEVKDNVSAAASALGSAAKLLEDRMKLLRANRCTDIVAFQSIPEDKVKYVSGFSTSNKLSRQIIVIDEAAEIFLAGPNISAKDVQLTRRLASTIAAQGRAVGIHLIIGTQRPDRNAVDMLTKTNLQGRLCFPMADNPSSMTILDNTRAANLPSISGRAIWKNGMEMVEVQTPLLKAAEAEALLASQTQAKKEVIPVQVEPPSDNGKEDSVSTA